MGQIQRHFSGRGLRLPAALLIALGLLLLAAAISLGKGGPRTANYPFAADSSGTGGEPVPPKEEPRPAPVKPPPDTIPPVIAINGSKAVSGSRFAFTFSSEDPGTTFTCKVGAKPAVPCTSPYRTGHLAPGPHVLILTASDAAGNATFWTRGFFVKRVKRSHSKRPSLLHAGRTSTPL